MGAEKALGMERVSARTLQDRGINTRMLSPRAMYNMGFHMPGRETVIPLVVEPLMLPREEVTALSEAAVALCQIKTKALAFALTQPALRDILLAGTNEEFRGYVEDTVARAGSQSTLHNVLAAIPTFHRPDFLRTTEPPTDPRFSRGYKLLEFNDTRPGGVNLTITAANVLREAGHDFEPLVADVPKIAQFYRTIAEQRGIQNANVLLGSVKEYVSAMEMPLLARQLQEYADQHGWDMHFDSYDRDDIVDTGRELVDPAGRKIDILLENAVPPFKFLAAEREGRVVAVNGALQTLGDNKALTAIICNEVFLDSLPAQQRALVRAMLPDTSLLTDANGLDNLLTRAQGDYQSYVFKPIQGSSGKDVYIGYEMTDADVAAVRANLARGTIYVAQALVPPREPWITVTRVNERGQFHKVSVFGDLNPYVANPGNGQHQVLGFLSRVRPSHPINISQFGSLEVVGTTR